MSKRFSRLLILVSAMSISNLAFAAEPGQQLPVGTLLPAVLDSNINSEKSKPGQKISARVKQDVPLPDNGKVKAGSEILGHVVSVKGASASSPGNVVLVFDTLKSDGRSYPLTTSLRAIASMAAVYQARLPISGSVPDNLSVWDWTTRQIGGEIVFGGQRKVESTIGVVGTMVEPGWVIAIPRENPEAGCPTPDNKNLQAFWIFSTDACGAYGWEGMQILRAPQDTAGGKITMASPKKIEIRSGSGLLLTVEKQQASGTGAS
jgi:hypothetical protein